MKLVLTVFALVGILGVSVGGGRVLKADRDENERLLREDVEEISVDAETCSYMPEIVSEPAETDTEADTSSSAQSAVTGLNDCIAVAGNGDDDANWSRNY